MTGKGVLLAARPFCWRMLLTCRVARSFGFLGRECRRRMSLDRLLLFFIFGSVWGDEGFLFSQSDLALLEMPLRLERSQQGSLVSNATSLSKTLPPCWAAGFFTIRHRGAIWMDYLFFLFCFGVRIVPVMRLVQSGFGKASYKIDYNASIYRPCTQLCIHARYYFIV
jgi:hypothetical protein